MLCVNKKCTAELLDDAKYCHICGKKQAQKRKTQQQTYRKTFSYDGRRYDVTAKSSEELAVKVAMRMRDLEEGKKRITKHMTVKDWADEWKAVYKEPTVSPKTMVTVNAVINSHINPSIGNMRLADVKPVHCQAILNRQKGRSKSLLNKILIYMREMFKKAKGNGLLIENPAADLTMPKYTNGTHRTITAVERKLLLEVCETHEHGLWALTMLYCGHRPSETESFTGKDIDVKNKMLYIDGTKTKASKRYVPIPDVLFHKLKPYAAEPFEYVFKNAKGQRINADNRAKMWKSLRKAMHIAAGGKTDYGELQRIVPPHLIAKDFVPYCLRHTYCTDLQDMGVPITVAKELMGHTTIAMTANIYTHRSDTSIEDARVKMNSHVG